MPATPAVAIAPAARRRLAALAALALAACSPARAPDPRPSASASASPRAQSPAPAAPPAAPAAVTARDDHARPAPGDLKTFGDWTVACDNILRCTMASLGADGGEFPAVTMRVARAAGPDGALTVTLETLSDDTAAPAAIMIGQRRFAMVGGEARGAAARAIVTVAAKAASLAVHDARDATIAAVSLTGAAAALRYIDARQHRAGTVTAIVATGARPAAAVPAAPPAPMVAAVAFAGAAPAPGAALVARMRQQDRCDPTTVGDPRAYKAADGATLVLLPCSAGAYNRIDALFVIRDGRVTPAAVDAPSGFEATGADPATPVHSVINGDVAGGVLTSDAKGRGLGDCGVRQEFVWDGRGLRLTAQSAMGECRGNPHYLPVWRAAVAR